MTKERIKDLQLLKDFNKDELIIAGLVTYGNIDITAREIGIPAATINLKMLDKDFKERYQYEVLKAEERLPMTLSSWLLPAVNMTANVMTDVDTAPETRVEAAKVLLEFYKTIN